MCVVLFIMDMSEIAVLLARGALTIAFGWSAGHKLRNRNRFLRTVIAYDILPLPVAHATSRLVPYLEVAVCVGYLTGFAPLVTSIAGSFLVSVFSLAILINLARGRYDLDCGCFDFASKIGWHSIARNLCIMATAYFAAQPIPPQWSIVPRALFIGYFPHVVGLTLASYLVVSLVKQAKGVFDKPS